MNQGHTSLNAHEAYLTAVEEKLMLAVRVIPRARKNEITENADGSRLKIRLQAPPVDGKANQALIKFLAEIMEIPASNIEIISGEKSRDKLLLIRGLDLSTASQRFLEFTP